MMSIASTQTVYEKKGICDVTSGNSNHYFTMRDICDIHSARVMKATFEIPQRSHNQRLLRHL